MQRNIKINKPELIKIMQAGEIQSVSIATGRDKNNITSTQIENTKPGSTMPVIEKNIYGAASLSKPVFTYLVLKLIGSNDFQLDTQLHKILSFEKFCKKFNI